MLPYDIHTSPSSYSYFDFTLHYFLPSLSKTHLGCCKLLLFCIFFTPCPSFPLSACLKHLRYCTVNSYSWLLLHFSPLFISLSNAPWMSQLLIKFCVSPSGSNSHSVSNPPSRALTQLMFPRRVLISPLCPSMRIGCARGHLGIVFVLEVMDDGVDDDDVKKRSAQETSHLPYGFP